MIIFRHSHDELCVSLQCLIQQVNCRGQNAFGRRKRQIFDDTDASLSVSGSDYVGQLREEVTVQSNPILALERREERLTDPFEGNYIIQSHPIFQYGMFF